MSNTAPSRHELAYVFTDSSQMVNDARIDNVRDLNKTYTFPVYTKREWLATAAALREHILVSNGLMPMPEKTPLNAQIFGRIEREDYTVEKVCFEAYPGFFTTGNLYRPKGKVGPFPGIVSPHGHWGRGRLENSESGSVPGRCINFARQGYVIFSYDMVGRCDSGEQIDHQYGGAREALWGLSLMALQLWNGIRSVDFLESLPDVDTDRIGCTGASGGGTQAFMLTAIDDRIKVSAPVNMISAHMQGGCLCENAPNLRLDVTNMEIGAMMAPRPLLMVSATGDWTANTPSVEYPAILSIYAHFNAEDKIHQVQIDAGHNYNKESREAVYAWFGKWLLGEDDPTQFKEVPFEVEADEALLVFHDRDLPPHALNAAQLTRSRIESAEKQLAERRPTGPDDLERFREEMGTALRHALAIQNPTPADLNVEQFGSIEKSEFTAHRLLIGRNGVGDQLPAMLFSPKAAGEKRPATLIVHPEGKAHLIDPETGDAMRLIVDLLAAGQSVLTVDVFLTGEHQSADGKTERDDSVRYFTTYNRTDAALRVQDILTALAYLTGKAEVSAVNLVGIGEAGLWSLLAAGFADADRIVADVNAFESDNDAAYLQSLPVPSIRRAGDFRTAGTLVTPRHLLIHNTGSAFETDWIADVYQAASAADRLRTETQAVSSEGIAEWLLG
ncbi:MAG: acetylxylan esterase [Candidatus Poribacteria bacterium]|nr:acetylxylan esterase [Candidatus Poribacteria bacterium]